jgi:hypothetical protein
LSTDADRDVFHLASSEGRHAESKLASLNPPDAAVPQIGASNIPSNLYDSMNFVAVSTSEQDIKHTRHMLW